MHDILQATLIKAKNAKSKVAKLTTLRSLKTMVECEIVQTLREIEQEIIKEKQEKKNKKKK